MRLPGRPPGPARERLLCLPVLATLRAGSAAESLDMDHACRQNRHSRRQGRQGHYRDGSDCEFMRGFELDSEESGRVCAGEDSRYRLSWFVQKLSHVGLRRQAMSVAPQPLRTRPSIQAVKATGREDTYRARERCEQESTNTGISERLYVYIMLEIWSM